MSLFVSGVRRKTVRQTWARVVASAQLTFIIDFMSSAIYGAAKKRAGIRSAK